MPSVILTSSAPSAVHTWRLHRTWILSMLPIAPEACFTAPSSHNTINLTSLQSTMALCCCHFGEVSITHKPKATKNSTHKKELGLQSCVPPLMTELRNKCSQASSISIFWTNQSTMLWTGLFRTSSSWLVGCASVYGWLCAYLELGVGLFWEHWYSESHGTKQTEKSP